MTTLDESNLENPAFSEVINRKLVLTLSFVMCPCDTLLGGCIPRRTHLKAVYYTVVVHNINLQEKTTSTVEVTTNFVKKFKAHFEKKLLY